MYTKSKIVNLFIFLFLFGICLNFRLSKEIFIEYYNFFVSQLIELIPIHNCKSQTVTCFEFKLLYLFLFCGSGVFVFDIGYKLFLNLVPFNVMKFM